MDFIIGWQDYETEFNGQKVTMQLRSLKRDAYMVLLSSMSTFEDFQADAVSTQDANRMMEMVDKFAPYFGEYVKNIEGFTVNGENPTPDKLVEEAAFSPLVMDIISRLSVISTLSVADAKN